MFVIIEFDCILDFSGGGLAHSIYLALGIKSQNISKLVKLEYI
jgi:hypothetical protein